MNALKSIKLLAGRSCYFSVVSLRRFSETDNYEPLALRPKKPKAKEATSQFFVDELHTKTIGGKGGDGCISFLHEFANEKAGPDGGDGGNGAHVIFKASPAVQGLQHLKHTIKGQDGERGFNRDCSGKSAKHEYVLVPVGTVVRNKNRALLADLNRENMMFLAARGGAGGRGNHFFISDTFQAPEVAELGGEGESMEYILEVKSMAHIGLVGMPNAGKSTLLRSISRARPMVAGYAFTTLKPHIGAVQYSDHQQVAVADLPGLIEGSNENKGLGIQFLKHAERCRGILFVIDLSVEDPFLQYKVVKNEISKFSEELSGKPYAVVGNKIDLDEAKNNLKKFEEQIGHPVIAISAKTGTNLKQLLKQIRKMYDKNIEKSEN